MWNSVSRGCWRDIAEQGASASHPAELLLSCCCSAGQHAEHPVVLTSGEFYWHSGSISREFSTIPADAIFCLFRIFHQWFPMIFPMQTGVCLSTVGFQASPTVATTAFPASLESAPVGCLPGVFNSTPEGSFLECFVGRPFFCLPASACGTPTYISTIQTTATATPVVRSRSHFWGWRYHL